MPDKKLTDNEIVKALECHSRPTNSCGSNCPYLMCEEVMCTKKLSKDALDLINRLQEENERLKEALKVQGERLVSERGQKYEQIDVIHNLKQELKTAKAEAYKEFAEKLKSRIITTYQYFDEQKYPRATVSDIDRLLKEMEGEDNA